RYGALEIHWHLFGGTDSYYLTKNALNSAFSAKKSNYIYRLSPEFMLLHLCSHLYSHASRVLCLRMFCDINELLRNHESVIDWEVVYENTKSIDFKEKIFTVLLLVRSIFKTPLPEIILKENKLLMECVSLDSLRNGFLPKETALVNNKFSEYIINIKKLKKQSDRLLLLYRTLFPEKEWLEYYYQETNTCKNTENLSARFFFEYLKNKFNSS
ncbi:MAG: nucleotidyltransferase family protein, partial [Chlorobiaceae bacterium]|nr:nucleotidyltransferase family protein [Chlorobiaceae bacterium]